MKKSLWFGFVFNARNSSINKPILMRGTKRQIEMVIENAKKKACPCCKNFLAYMIYDVDKMIERGDAKDAWSAIYSIVSSPY